VDPLTYLFIVFLLVRHASERGHVFRAPDERLQPHAFSYKTYIAFLTLAQLRSSQRRHSSFFLHPPPARHHGLELGAPWCHLRGPRQDRLTPGIARGCRRLLCRIQELEPSEVVAKLDELPRAYAVASTYTPSPRAPQAYSTTPIPFR
jgi:hypothetical protein